MSAKRRAAAALGRRRALELAAIAATERAEDVRWFVETGECLSGAAARLGIKPASLEEWCKDHGMRAEMERLRDREPFDSDVAATVRGKAGAAARWAS